MLPQQALSTVPQQALFLAPRNVATPLTESQELGGIALNNSSQGLEYQVWTCTTDGVNVSLSAPNYNSTVQFSGTSITEVSLAFDQNMKPFVAFVDSGVAKFWWYDSQSESQIFTLLPTGAINPRATLDDKRPSQIANSDIILAYINNSTLYFRAQRDRYTIEYTLKSNVNNLVTIGMGNALRMLFQCE